MSATQCAYWTTMSPWLLHLFPTLSTNAYDKIKTTNVIVFYKTEPTVKVTYTCKSAIPSEIVFLCIYLKFFFEISCQLQWSFKKLWDLQPDQGTLLFLRSCPYRRVARAVLSRSEPSYPRSSHRDHWSSCCTPITQSPILTVLFYVLIICTIYTCTSEKQVEVT